MAYATYRLYYETEVFDEGSYDDDYYTEESACVAVIAIDLADDTEAAELAEPAREQEMQLSMLQPGAPHAPEWYDAETAEEVIQQIAHIVQASPDGTFEIREPNDPRFDLERGAIVNAEGLNTATLMAMDNGAETRIFEAFCIEYCPPKGEPFPVALFILDPLERLLMGSDFKPYNPFAPPSFKRRAAHDGSQDRGAVHQVDEALHGQGRRARPVQPRALHGPAVQVKEVALGGGHRHRRCHGCGVQGDGGGVAGQGIVRLGPKQEPTPKARSKSPSKSPQQKPDTGAQTEPQPECPSANPSSSAGRGSSPRSRWRSSRGRAARARRPGRPRRSRG